MSDRMTAVESKLVGRQVTITAKDSWAYGEWGIVKMFDGEYYHIAPWNDSVELVFTRDEFRVPRKK